MSAHIICGDDIESIVIAKLAAALDKSESDIEYQLLNIKNAEALDKAKDAERLTQLLTMNTKETQEQLKMREWDSHEIEMARENQPGISKKAMRIRNNAPTNYTAPKKKRKR